MSLRDPSIATAVREARRNRGWTLKALALRLGISPDLLQKIELGTATPDPELLKNIRAWLADANARLE
jgi:transcriptional regulator with XRE-family HTH domain